MRHTHVEGRESFAGVLSRRGPYVPAPVAFGTMTGLRPFLVRSLPMERTLNWEHVLLAGRYQVLRTLGTGGMALVYLAHDHHLDCEVVIKTPRPEVFTGSVVARFTREIRSLVRLTHPHIVKILDVGEHEG